MWETSPFVWGSNPRDPTRIIRGQLLALSKESDIFKIADIFKSYFDQLLGMVAELKKTLEKLEVDSCTFMGSYFFWVHDFFHIFAPLF